MLQKRKPGLWWHLLTDAFGIVWWNIDSERPYCRLCSHECSWKDSNQTIPRDCRRRKYCRLDFRIPAVPDSSWTLLSCRWEPLKENSVCFCVTYLESVGDHPGSNVSDTSFRCSEPIMLRGCRQLLEGQIQLDIICIRMDTSQVVLNDVEDPSYLHDRSNRHHAATL